MVSIYTNWLLKNWLWLIRIFFDLDWTICTMFVLLLWFVFRHIEYFQSYLDGKFLKWIKKSILNGKWILLQIHIRLSIQYGYGKVLTWIPHSFRHLCGIDYLCRIPEYSVTNHTVFTQYFILIQNTNRTINKHYRINRCQIMKLNYWHAHYWPSLLWFLQKTIAK